uniref:V-type proton ATPase subunit G n=1 Tax=Felis catus TaxID=9685 RepID=A0ABI7X3Z3_FELCA
MASQSQGIQQLLQAEKRAAEKVSEARKRKNRRLKQAKEEAQAEIEQYRLQREKEFKAKEAANIVKKRCHVFIMLVNPLPNVRTRALTSVGPGIPRQLQH